MRSRLSLPGGDALQTAAPAGARAPKRRRGHLRVAAIMQAGVEAFAEKGFDAATMTEIAARSGTAIASLYRFFPSKEALADALLLQFAQHALGRLDALRQRVAGLPPDGIAGALVDFRVELQSHRGFAVALADARDAGDGRREEFRAAMQGALAAVLRAGLPGVDADKAAAMAAVLLHILKGVAAFDREEPALRGRLLAETRMLIGAYLAAAGAGDAG